LGHVGGHGCVQVLFARFTCFALILLLAMAPNVITLAIANKNIFFIFIFLKCKNVIVIG